MPQAEAAATLAKAAERERMEEGLREQLRAGRTTVQALTLESYLEAGGIAL
ncbi:hypothetical protein D3C71_2206490 [compost metagenome]